jgi:type IV secretory pathway VirB2 component (pilin)
MAAAAMMDGMGGMMWGAGLVWLLLVIVLVLAAAALVKYLRSDGTK